MPTNNFTMSTIDFELYCRKIHDSFGNLRQLIPSLVSLDQTQRQQIREKYRAAYGEDLISSVQRYEAEFLDSAALSMWMLDTHERDAMVVREALEQADKDYKAVVKIFVGRKSSHILLIKQAYQRIFRRQLDQDVVSLEPPHPFQKILVALAASLKDHEIDFNQHIAKCDARRLYETGEGGSVAIEEAVVLEILSKRSIPQLKLTFSSYKHMYGHDYTKALMRGNYSEFEKAMKLVVKCICNPSNYYAKVKTIKFQCCRINRERCSEKTRFIIESWRSYCLEMGPCLVNRFCRAIKGAISDKGTLARVLVSRADVDLNEIQRVFKHKYEKELGDVIRESISSGDLRDFLVAIVTTYKNFRGKQTTNAV